MKTLRAHSTTEGRRGGKEEEEIKTNLKCRFYSEKECLWHRKCEMMYLIYLFICDNSSKFQVGSQPG